ncbi:MAG: S9 family peptidase [Pyrinomonadaceae bacterium]
MRKLRLISFFLVLVASISSAAMAEVPELVDREVFFGNPEISGAQISPDGKWITFMKPFEGTRNVWIKARSEKFEDARLLTSETKRPVGGYFWSRDSQWVLFVKDNGGDENFNVFAVNPSEAKSKTGAPASRNITSGEKVRAMLLAVPRSEPGSIYVGLNDRDPAWHDYYKVNLKTGAKELVLKNTERLQGLVFDNADKMRLAVRSAPDGTTEILSFAGGETKVIYSCSGLETCSPAGFSEDNKSFYMATNKGERDLTQLVRIDPETGKETFVEEDPEKRVDFGGAIAEDATGKILATVYEDDKTRIYFKDGKFKKEYEWLKSKLGDMDISLGSQTRDEKVAIVSASSDVEPGITYLFDRENKKLEELYRIRENLPRNILAEMKPIRYKSSDGLEIPAYLTLPKGVKAENLPLVVFPHGGPWARDSWGYHTYAQFLANRGYAVLQPNFRASTGFGKAFLNAGNNQWGDLVQDDITWGVKHLIEKGIVDPKRVGIMGGSFGGYATLAGVTFTPDMYSAAVAIVAPSNLITLLESIPPYWEAGRIIFYKRMGDPNTEAGRAQMIRQSPLTHVDKIKTPLMVVQGANDPRVNIRESDQIVVALRERNYPVEYIVAPDEGHGFARPVNNMAMIAAAEKFMAKHLGGRFQESMTPEVAKRLKEITVDPKSVVVKAPNKASGVVGGVWILDFDAGGQSVPVTLDIIEKDDAFTGTVNTPFGNGTVENGKIEGKTITCDISLDFQGQPLNLKLNGTVDGDKLNGSLNGPGIPAVSFSGSRKK